MSAFLQRFARAARTAPPQPPNPVGISASEFRTETIQAVIVTASDNYREFARITGIVDDKAQKTMQTAGLFLGAAFAFIKPEAKNIKSVVGLGGLVLLALAVSALLFSIVFGLVVMKVRSIPTPLTAQAMDKIRKDLAALPDSELTAEHRDSFFGEQLRIWLASLRAQQNVNSSKSSWLWKSQLALALAMAMVAVLLLMVLRTAIL